MDHPGGPRQAAFSRSANLQVTALDGVFGTHSVERVQLQPSLSTLINPPYAR
jgi:hypothetical protein